MHKPFWSWDLKFILSGNGKARDTRVKRKRGETRRLRSEKLTPRLLLAADIGPEELPESSSQGSAADVGPINTGGSAQIEEAESESGVESAK